MSIPSNWPLPGDGVRFIVPRAMVEAMRASPVCSDLHATAFGYYPNARGHAAERLRHDDNLLIYCVRGRGTLQVRGETCSVRKGHVVILERGLAHRYQADAKDPWTIYWVHFSGERDRDYLRRSDGTPFDTVTDAGVLTKALSDFGALLDSRNSTHRQAAFFHAANNLKQLICYLGMPRPGSEESRMVDTVHAVMLERLNFGVTLDELADAVHLSKHHFARRYRAVTGVPPLTRFNQLRMEHACELLDSGAAPIAAIASRIGIEDAYYFSRLFRRVVGMTPSAYRSTRQG